MNCQRSREVTYDLMSTMCKQKTNFALIQEPYRYLGKARGFPMNFKVVNSQKAALVFQNDDLIDVMEISNLCKPWCAIAGVTAPYGDLVTISAYCTPGEDLEPILEQLHIVLSEFRATPVILCMDANSTSPLWSSRSIREDLRR